MPSTKKLNLSSASWVLGTISMLFMQACAIHTAAQARADSVRAQVRGLLTNERACFATFEDQPRFARIRAKMPIRAGAGLPDAAQLSDSTMPTQEDLNNVVDWLAFRSPCISEDMERLGAIDPELVVIVSNIERSYADLLRLVIASPDFSYGDINYLIAKIQTQGRQSFLAWTVNLSRKLRAEDSRQRTEIQTERQQLWSEVGEVAETLAEAAVAAVGALAVSEAELRSARARYVMPQSDEPAQSFTTTTCSWFYGVLTCRTM